MTYIEDQHFNATHTAPLVAATYERCMFRNRDFAQQDLSGFVFDECVFEGCNLSLCKLGKTALRQVTFRDCKLLALSFDQCNPLGLSMGFENCVLSQSSFYKVACRKTVFQHCQLREADFTGADLQGARLDQCDLTDATFDQTNLEKADLRTAINYVIDPTRNRLRGARVSARDLVGLVAQWGLLVE